MSNGKSLLLTTIGLAAAVMLVGSLIIWPNYHKAVSIRRQASTLRVKIASLGQQAQQIEQTAAEIARAQQRIDKDFKTIPESADTARLISKLSLPVDGTTVLDQTIATGSPSEAITGGKSHVLVWPVTVDIEATFDSVFAVIRVAETMERLIRLESVHMQCLRDQKQDVPIVKASLGLQAVYEPSSEQEGQ